MSNQSRKYRGYNTQALIAQDLKDCEIYPWATDAGAGRPGKDILNTPGAAIEVKARTNFEPVASLRQAMTNCKDDETPVVVSRMNGQGEKSIDSWVAFTTWGEMKKLLAMKVELEKNEYKLKGTVYLCQICDEVIGIAYYDQHDAECRKNHGIENAI